MVENWLNETFKKVYCIFMFKVALVAIYLSINCINGNSNKYCYAHVTVLALYPEGDTT